MTPNFIRVNGRGTSCPNVVRLSVASKQITKAGGRVSRSLYSLHSDSGGYFTRTLKLKAVSQQEDPDLEAFKNA